jgi:hypothetical protein
VELQEREVVENEQKPEQTSTVEMVVAIISLMWSGCATLAFLAILLLWPEGYIINPTLLHDVLVTVFVYGSLGSVPVALLTAPMNISNRLKLIVGIAALIPLIIFGTKYIMSIPSVA